MKNEKGDTSDITISTFRKYKNNEHELLQINDFDFVNDKVERVKTYKITKLGGGKSGALIYKIQDVNNLQTEQLLKIYKEKSNLERNIREISVYCTFDTIKKDIKNIELPFFPTILTKGYIKKDSEFYPETPYIITTLAKGKDLRKILTEYKTHLDMKVKDKDGKLLYNYKLFYDIMTKILDSLLKINEIISFSHEDLHPENIMINIDKDTNSLIDITIIDFDLAEIGDVHYDDNKINPVTRPFTRRISRCVPKKLNKTIEKVFEEDKDTYNDFLKEFDKCPLFRSLIKSNKDFNKIKLDRVVVIYYLFIFGYILKDKVVEDLEKEQDKLEKERVIFLKNNLKKIEADPKELLKQNKLKEYEELIKYKKNIDKNIEEIERNIHGEKGKYYTEVFFRDYDTLINVVSIDSSNELFYKDALSKFNQIYRNISNTDNFKQIYHDISNSDKNKKSVY